MTAVKLGQPFLIGTELLPCHAYPMVVEVGFEHEATNPAIGIIERMDHYKLLVETHCIFNGCSGCFPKAGYRPLHSFFYLPWGRPFELLSITKENCTTAWIGSGPVITCIAKYGVEKVVVEKQRS